MGWQGIIFRDDRQIRPVEERSYTSNQVNYKSSRSTRNTESKSTETHNNIEKGNYLGL